MVYSVFQAVTAVAGYNMHVLMSTLLNASRCFFAGDSAHQWFPAGGTGLYGGVGNACITFPKSRGQESNNAPHLITP